MDKTKNQEADMKRVCELLGFDPTNHHNAATCPYCTPELQSLREDIQRNHQTIEGREPMRAIIIEDKDAKALVEKLELAKLRKRISPFADTDTVESKMQEVHRLFHYEVVRWLQDMGCELR